MYQDSQVTDIPSLAHEVVDLTKKVEQLTLSVEHERRVKESMRTTVREWFINQFNGDGVAQIERDDVNELLEDIDAKKLSRTYDVTIRIEVTAQVEADDDDAAVDQLNDDISITASDYKIDWEVINSGATEAE